MCLSDMGAEIHIGTSYSAGVVRMRMLYAHGHGSRASTTLNIDDFTQFLTFWNTNCLKTHWISGVKVLLALNARCFVIFGKMLPPVVMTILLCPRGMFYNCREITDLIHGGKFQVAYNRTLIIHHKCAAQGALEFGVIYWPIYLEFGVIYCPIGQYCKILLAVLNKDYSKIFFS